MTDRNTVRSELEEQRCLIETQHIEIQRLMRHMEVQLRHTAELQAELDDIKGILQRAAPILQPTHRDHHGGNGNGHRAAPPLPPSLA